MGKIFYKSGYKYQLQKDYTLQTNILPKELITTDYIQLDTLGNLTVKRGYVWDGPSGPTIDTPSFMRASLVHDALYQFMREGYLSSSYRKQADQLLKQICKEDGMFSSIASVVYVGVRLLGKTASNSKYKNPILSAP